MAGGTAEGNVCVMGGTAFAIPGIRGGPGTIGCEGGRIGTPPVKFACGSGGIIPVCGGMAGCTRGADEGTWNEKI